MGNESGLGTNFVEAAKWIKNFDDTRLLHYESVHKQDDTSDEIFDVVSRMYPSVQDWKKMSEDKNEKRLIYDTDIGRPASIICYFSQMGRQESAKL